MQMPSRAPIGISVQLKSVNSMCCFFINSWIEMITVLNEMAARSLGQPDFYPFVMPRAVVRKLHFVSLVVNGARS
jgi:hypothetical protein